MIPEGFESLGLQLSMIVWIAALVVLIALFLVGLALYRHDHEDFGATVSAGAICLLGIALLTGAVAGFPYQAKYWRDYRLSGHVTSASNVLDPHGGDLTRKPVVRLAGRPTPVVVDDPRAVDLQGKGVVLRCSIDYHWRAMDTYTCAIAEVA